MPSSAAARGPGGKNFAPMTGTWGYKFRTQGRTEIVCAEITTEREN